MTDGDRRSILLVHHRDLASPFGTTLPHYVAEELAEDRPVHVVCRKLEAERNDGADGRAATLHAIGTGEVPVVSGLLFHLLATLYAPVVAGRHRIDVVYAFQLTVLQGWVAARLARARFVVGLDSVPVRQREDFAAAAPGTVDLRERLVRALHRPYVAIVGALLERADAVLPLTDGIAETTGAVYDVDLSGAESFGMGVDVERFRSARPDGAWQSDARTLTYVGTIAPVRDLGHVLEAVAASDHEIRFRLAGGGDEAAVADLRERAAELGIADRVTFLGMLPHEEIPTLLASSDWAISPLPDIESFRVSFPAKLVEYLASGSVVIATDVTPHRRLVEDGENGVLYDGTPAGLVAAFDRAVEAADEGHGLERRAVETAERYDWSRVAGRYESALLGSPATEEGTGEGEPRPRATAESPGG